MRHLFAIICLLSLLSISCKKTNSSLIPNGTYQGTFQRQVSGSGQISNVTIIFSSGTWTGQSQFPHYPALCRGTVISNDGNITFQNTCFWTTDFDGTLILHGDYKIKVNGPDIEISRDYTGAYLTGDKDIYKLTRQ